MGGPRNYGVLHCVYEHGFLVCPMDRHTLHASVARQTKGKGRSDERRRNWIVLSGRDESALGVGIDELGSEALGRRIRLLL